LQTEPNDSKPAADMKAPPILYSMVFGPAFIWSLAVVCWSALVLLQVDMGRKLRVIARNTTRQRE